MAFKFLNQTRGRLSQFHSRLCEPNSCSWQVVRRLPCAPFLLGPQQPLIATTFWRSYTLTAPQQLTLNAIDDENWPTFHSPLLTLIKRAAKLCNIESAMRFYLLRLGKFYFADRCGETGPAGIWLHSSLVLATVGGSC